MSDLLLYNGAIGDPAADASAILVRDSRIHAVGGSHELRAFAGRATPAIDLEGRRVIPGLVDGHAHVVRAGMRWDREVRWDSAATLQDALARVRERAGALAPGNWILVIGGWHPRQFLEGRGPTRTELDAVAPGHPCFVQLLYDEAVLNSAGLAAAGLNDGALLAGQVEVRDDGQPTGVIRGAEAYRHCLGASGTPTFDEQVQSTRAMLADLARYGLTGALDPGGIGLTPESYAALYEVWRRDELTLRTRLFLGAGRIGEERRQVEDWMRFLPRGFGDDWLRITGIGEIVLFSCWDGNGLSPFAPDDEALGELRQISRTAAAAGWPMHLHAVVDDSATAILDAWEAVNQDVAISPLRFSFAHADAFSAATLRRARALGVGLAIQNWIMLRSAVSAPVWGDHVVAEAPPLGSMLELGFPISAGTDGTVANSMDPWRALWWLVSGMTIDGGPRRLPAHRLTRSQALGLYTRGSAWFSFEEERRGQLKAGHLADLLVLDDDYFTVPEEEIRTIRPDVTMVGGRVAFRAESFSGIEDFLPGFPARTAGGEVL